MDTLKLYGPPGTGKTYSGIEWLVKQVETGGAAGAAGAAVDVRQAAFVSFTNAACDEARSRVCERFGVEPDEVPYCATLHALAKRALPVEGRDWLADDHLAEFAKEHGFDLKPPRKRGAADPDDMGSVAEAEGRDAPLLHVWDFGRHRRLSDPAEALRAYRAYDPDGAMLVEFPRFRKFAGDYESWKRQEGLLDYTDLLVLAVERGCRVPAAVAVVDEAQDLSPLLWAAADSLFAETARRATLGDDDQALYSFQGAAPELMNDRPAGEVVKLRQSYRLPRRVCELATRVIGRNRNRTEKETVAREEEGSVHRAAGLSGLEWTNGESWFLLIRNWKFFAESVAALEARGVPYRCAGGRKYSPWSDRGPLRAVRALLALAAGARIRLSELLPLVEKTPSQVGSRPGAWVFGAKKRIEELAGRSPGATCSLLDLPRLGLTESGFDAIVDRDLHLLAGHVSDRDRAAYENAIKAGNWDRPVTVTVGSMHGAKGQEADHVAAYMACTGAPLRSLTRPHRREEENRISYVTITRARKSFTAVQARLADGGHPYEVFGL